MQGGRASAVRIATTTSLVKEVEAKSSGLPSANVCTAAERATSGRIAGSYAVIVTHIYIAQFAEGKLQQDARFSKQPTF